MLRRITSTRAPASRGCTSSRLFHISSSTSQTALVAGKNRNAISSGAQAPVSGFRESGALRPRRFLSTQRDMSKIKDSAFYVTGCATPDGIGNALVVKLLSQGAKIFACDLVVSGLDKQFSKEIKNGTLATCALDVTDWKASRRSFESAVQTFGSLDNVILNAGMLEPKSFWGDQDEAPYLPMEVNASATFRGTRLAIDQFLRQDSEGLIIITGSVMGQIPGPKTPLYCASKWAVEGFVRSLAFLHKAANVRVVVLEPGVIKTSFWEQIGVDQHTLPNAGTSSVATVVEAWEDIIHDPVGIPGGSAYEVSGSATRLYTLDSPRCKDESPLDGKGLLELIKAAARKV